MTTLQRLAIAPTQRHDTTLTLTEAQQHYLYRVLRLHRGDRFIALDGRQGQGWLVELGHPPRAQVLEAIAVETELPVSLTLLVAMPKTGMDDIVRQVTELGVAHIVPVMSDRTLLKPSDQKLDRWRRIAQEATEQSERQWIPTIANPISWQDCLNIWHGAIASCFLCVARGNPPHLLNALSPSPGQTSPWVIATGPEGGWTEAEQEAAIAVGYQSVSLGRRILRAVTAPGMAVALMAAVLESIEASEA